MSLIYLTTFLWIWCSFFTTRQNGGSRAVG